MVASILKLWCLSACEKSTSSHTLFIRYYTLNSLAIWLGERILAQNLRTKISPSTGFAVKYQYHFRFIAEMSNSNKNFQKLEKKQKAPSKGHFFGLFYSKLDQWKFSLKIQLRQFLALKKFYMFFLISNSIFGVNVRVS